MGKEKVKLGVVEMGKEEEEEVSKIEIYVI